MAEEKKGGPEHDASVCVWKAGRWECLHGVDANHFWYGDVLVDLNQLRREESRASSDYTNFTNMQCHSIGQSLGALVLYAKQLLRGEQVSSGSVGYCLKNLNKMGLHTGVVFKD